MNVIDAEIPSLQLHIHTELYSPLSSKESVPGYVQLRFTLSSLVIA